MKKLFFAIATLVLIYGNIFAAGAMLPASPPELNPEEKEAKKVEMTLEEQRKAISEMEGLSDKKKAKLERKLDKIMEKTKGAEVSTVGGDENGEKKGLAQKLLEKKLAKKAKKVEEAQMSRGKMVTLGLIIALAGLLVALTVSYSLGILAAIVGLVLIVIGIL